jgi:hypothetical protein
LSRIALAFRSFFSILFGGGLSSEVALAFGYSKIAPRPKGAPAAPKPPSGPADGAVQILAVLQRDARLVDFLMEDVSAYTDEQIGAAVRDVQQQARTSLQRCLSLAPVIDGVEGTFTKIEPMDAAAVKLVGNVPASGQAAGGLLRHKGWRAERVDLPAASPGAVLAPAEIEIE